MRIQATCESCSHDFSVSPNSAGKRVRCPECGEAVRVPEEGSAPPRSRSKSRGRKAEKSSNNNGLVIGLAAGIGGAVVIVGLIVVVSGSRSAPVAPPQNPGQQVAVTAPTAVPSASAPMAHQSAMSHGQPVTQHGQPMAHAQTTSQHGQQPMTTPHGQSPANAGPHGQNVASTSTPAMNTPGSAHAASSGTKSDDAKAAAAPKTKLDLVELIAKVEPSVVRITTSGPRGGGTGSGFVVDTKGTVVTNVHVIAGAKKAEVEFSNGTKAPVIGYHYLDQKKDIAIIKIDLAADKLIPVPLATTLPPKGTAVVAFGAPHGLSFTTTEGIISALRPADEMKEQFGEDFQGDWIQTSTPISPGNSGGPLVNHFGEVVAMNTMQMTIGQNLNFAMSAVDIAAAVEKAPSEYKPISAEVIKQASTSRSRSMASDETETDRGKRLLSEVSEIFLLNATNRKTLALDATGLIWDRVIAKSKGAVEKSKIQLSIGEPSDDAAVMFVVLELRTSKKKTVTAGTQELYITAELICKDDFAGKGESKVCRIWKSEDNLGTISIAALQNGNFPRTAEENVSKFFTKFRTACVKARESQKDKDGDKKDDKDSKKS